jgi:sulfite dehydrogenase (cytochrome) subunit B
VAAALALAGAGRLPRAAEPKGAPAQLQEEPIQLKDAPGRDLTAGRCNICHSLEYIPSNAPAMNRAVWQKEVLKMKDRFGAPITDEEAKQILDYLDGSYSGNR